eukprot:gene4448-biopygen4895
MDQLFAQLPKFLPGSFSFSGLVDQLQRANLKDPAFLSAAGAAMLLMGGGGLGLIIGMVVLSMQFGGAKEKVLGTVLSVPLPDSVKSYMADKVIFSTGTGGSQDATGGHT